MSLLVKSTLPESVGSRWTSDEESRLLELIANGADIQEIATKHKRTKGGIRSRLNVIAVRMIETEGKSMQDVSETLCMKVSKIAAAQKRFGAQETELDVLKETELDVLKEIRAILLRMEASLFTK
jgi:hypothetical protein